jgi:hypothetical protein
MTEETTTLVPEGTQEPEKAPIVTEAKEDPALDAKTEADPGEPAAEPEQGEKEETKKPHRVPAKVRIAELTAQKYQAEAKATAAIAELERIRKQHKPLPPDASAEEVDEHRVRKVMREERYGQVSAEAQFATEAAARTRQQMFEAKAEAVADRMPGVLDKFYALPVVTEFMADFIVESDKTPELAFYLGSNPGEATRIASLPIAKQGVELARLEARLSPATVKKTSTAPSPPPIIKGAGAPAQKDPASMSMNDYAKWRANGGG